MGNELMRICGIALLCTIAALILRPKNSELVALLRVGGLVLMAGMLLTFFAEPFSEIRGMLSSSAMSSYVLTLLKAIGVAILCTVCAGICRDCGEASIAGCVEAAGNALILVLCIPVIRDILEQASSLMGLG